MNREITWNIVNSLLAGGISFFSGSLVANEITFKGIMIAIMVSAGIACIQFKKYWESEEAEYSTKQTLGSFIGI